MRKIMIAAGLAAALSGCATGPTRFPVQATRYHFDAMTDRGTIAVEPLTGSGTASIEYKTYAAAVESELLRLGYTPPPPGTRRLRRVRSASRWATSACASWGRRGDGVMLGADMALSGGLP
jgi:hypothetical protein